MFYDETKQQILTTGNDKTVKMWNLQGQPSGSVPIPGIGWSLHMEGPYLFVGCEVQSGQTTQGLIQVFNTATNESYQCKMNQNVPWSHGTRVSCLVTCGQFLFSGGGCWPHEVAQGKQPDNDIRVWQMNAQTKQFAMASQMQGHQASIMSICLTTDTKFLCSGDMKGNIATWSSANGSPIQMVPAHQSNDPKQPAFIMGILSEGNHLITASYNGEIKVWQQSPEGKLQPSPGVQPLNTRGVVCSIAATTDINNKPIIVCGCDRGTGK